jgi:hypothetical protein
LGAVLEMEFDSLRRDRKSVGCKRSSERRLERVSKQQKKISFELLLQFIAEAAKKLDRNLGFRIAKSGSEWLETLTQML